MAIATWRISTPGLMVHRFTATGCAPIPGAGQASNASSRPISILPELTRPARPRDNMGSWHDFAADSFTATIPTLSATKLREIVFEIIPRKMSIAASEASWIIEETRAFYAFLKRELRLPQADACLRVLGGDAVKKLEAALSDPRKFGMAKSLVMGGREAGFDMDSKEGIERWMRSVQSQPLPASIRLPSLGASSRTSDKAAALKTRWVGGPSRKFHQPGGGGRSRVGRRMMA